MKRSYLLMALLLVAPLSQAEPARYITDQFEITLRTGASTQHTIIKMLGSGAAVELLDTDTDSGYSRVRTADGVEGWVITRYLMDAPSARAQLANARKQVTTAKEQVQALNQQIEALNKEKSDLMANRDQLQTELQGTSQELARIRRTSSKAVEIDEERQQLKKYVRTLERDLQTVRTENEDLKDRSARDWFMVGAGVLLLGILTGAILARMRGRRRGGWESF